MRIKGFYLAALLGCMSFSVTAQETKAVKPKGKAIIQVFSNFHSGFGIDNDDRGFELDRGYLGYQYDLGKGVQIKAVMDVGRSNDVDDYHYIAYIKNAQISWKTGNWTLAGGMISTTQFNLQDKFWGHRYIAKSFQDEYKFGSSADLGLSVAYKIADWISADMMLVNGEGYKKVQKVDGMLLGMGATIQPVKGLTLRVYYGVNEASDETKANKYNLATFIGYKGKNFSIGAEYNHNQNTNNIKNNDLSGISIYGAINLNKNVEFYAKFDDLYSSNDWNITNDESALLTGLQFKIGKYVKVAPNFRMYMPKMEGGENRYMGYISCYFGI